VSAMSCVQVRVRFLLMSIVGIVVGKISKASGRSWFPRELRGYWYLEWGTMAQLQICGTQVATTSSPSLHSIASFLA
jgi:hypothetical protein